MTFPELVKKRRMVRNFTGEPVDPEVINAILDLARRGPSAGFTQGQSFVAISDTGTKEAVARLCGESSYVDKGFDPFISRAPVLILPCTSEEAYHRRYRKADKLNDDGSEIDWPIPYWYMDVGCAVMIILLAVVDQGLAAGFAGIWDVDGLRRLLEIPAEVTPVGVIPVGYPAPDKRSPSLKLGRKPIPDVVRWEKW